MGCFNYRGGSHDGATFRSGASNARRGGHDDVAKAKDPEGDRTGATCTSDGHGGGRTDGSNEEDGVDGGET